MVSAHEPKWIGQTPVLKSTAHGLKWERDDDPKWVHNFSRNRPDAIVTGRSPFPDMLRKKFGNDLSTLVGKTIEMVDRSTNSAGPKSAFALWIRRRSSW